MSNKIASDTNSFISYDNHKLAALCAKQSSLVNGENTEPNACYELFCRACISPFDDVAWNAIYHQYIRLVRLWLGQYASDDTVQSTFLRFFKAQKNSKVPFTTSYPNISAIMAYLKQCAVTVRITSWRLEAQQVALANRIVADPISPIHLVTHPPDIAYSKAVFKELVRAKLKGEKEQIVFELTYTYGLSPREIQAQYPDIFPTVQIIYRIRENLLKRLRRDIELQKWWSQS